MSFSLSRLQKILAVVLALLVFAISIAEIRLQEVLLNFYDRWDQIDHQILPARYQTAGDYGNFMYALPMDLRKPVQAVGIAAGGLGIATAATGLLGFLAQFLAQSEGPGAEKNKRHRNWSILVCILAGSAILYTLAIFIYAFIMEYTSSTFHFTDNLAFTAYTPGPHPGDVPPGSYTRESWACQMHQFYGKDSDYNGSIWGDGCRKGMAARWMLIPLLVAMLAFGVVAAMDCKAAIQRSRKKTGPAEEQENLASDSRVSSA